MTAYPHDINTANNGVKTSSEFGDPADANVVGEERWFHQQHIGDGANEALGATTSAAVTNPATDATAIAYIRGLLTVLGQTSDAAVTNPASSASQTALLKGLLTLFGSAGATSMLKLEDVAAASGDAGVATMAVRRDTPVAEGAAGDYTFLHVDLLNRLRVVGKADEDVSNSTSTALEATRVIKASAGKLFGLQGYSTSAGFIQIGNKTTALSGADATIVIVLPVEANKPFSLDFGRRGRAFSTGISIGISSTGAGTFTSAGSVMWVDAQYE